MADTSLKLRHGDHPLLSGNISRESHAPHSQWHNATGSPRAAFSPELYKYIEQLYPAIAFIKQRPHYWLHIEADSTVMRAEKEELVLLLNKGDPDAVMQQPVDCFDANDWGHSKKEGTCGKPKAKSGMWRHTTGTVNVYNWTNEIGGKITLSVSMAGGVYGNHGAMAATHRWNCSLVKPLPGIDLSENGGQEKLRASALARSQEDPLLCRATPGIGFDYWRSLFRWVGQLDGLRKKHSLPDAVVLNYGLHYTRCAEGAGPYVRQVDYRMRSLRGVYAGPVVWRAVSPPVIGGRHYYPPEGCLSATNLTMIEAPLREWLRQSSHVSIVDTAAIISKSNGSSSDPFHFDGGVLREIINRDSPVDVRDQNTSVQLLAALLSHLERLETHVKDHRSVRLSFRTPGNSSSSRSPLLPAATHVVHV